MIALIKQAEGSFRLTSRIMTPMFVYVRLVLAEGIYASLKQ